MAMTLAKVVRYISDPDNLYQQFKKGSYTADLEALTKFGIEEAGAVKVQSKSYTGNAQNYDGYGSVSTAATDLIIANSGWITYYLDQKKYYGMALDLIEEEESLNSTVSRINGLLRYKFTPDVDKYRFSKLAHKAGVTINGAALTTGDLTADLVGAGAALTASNIFTTIETALAKMAEEEVTGASYILYMTPSVLRILEDSDKITRFINSREIERDGLNVKIKEIVTSNGTAELRSIPAKYFCTFTEGAVTNDPNNVGLNANSVGDQDTNFRFLLVTKEAINAVVKVQEARIMPNGTIRGFRGNLFELFLYHDIFVIDRREGVGTADSTTLLTSAAFNGIIKCAITAVASS